MLLLTGVFAGAKEWNHASITIILTFILSRLSTELHYRIVKEVQNERLRILYRRIKDEI